MLMTMSRLSLCVIGSATAGPTPGSLTLASMNVQSAAATAAQRSRGFVDVNTGKNRRCHLRAGAWQTCRTPSRLTESVPLSAHFQLQQRIGGAVAELRHVGRRQPDLVEELPPHHV